MKEKSVLQASYGQLGKAYFMKTAQKAPSRKEQSRLLRKLIAENYNIKFKDAINFKLPEILELQKREFFSLSHKNNVGVLFQSDRIVGIDLEYYSSGLDHDFKAIFSRLFPRNSNQKVQRIDVLSFLKSFSAVEACIKKERVKNPTRKTYFKDYKILKIEHNKVLVEGRDIHEVELFYLSDSSLKKQAKSLKLRPCYILSITK